MDGSGTRAGVLGIVIGGLAAVTLTACAAGGGGQGGGQAQQASVTRPAQIFPAPKGLIAAAPPQPNGTLWALTGDAARRDLSGVNLAAGQDVGTIPVSRTARSVTESLTGVIGLALGDGRVGALELLSGSTGKVIRTVPLGLPARAVVVGSDGATFYVLGGNAKSATVTVVNSGDGDVQGTVPVPPDTVAVAPDAQGSGLYLLRPGGLVSQVAMAGGGAMTSFSVGSGARSLTVSPDGGTLYVLKDAGSAVNVAEVDLATQSVQRVLPAPAHCLQVLASADGSQLYEIVGTPAYGNIQVFRS